MTWDITYLKSCISGKFYYLYMILDLWSRKILGAEVHDVESADLSSALIHRVCSEFGVNPGSVLHSDNGSPMKGSTMLPTLQRLGVMPSFSRPNVSNDNPFSEALFRTLKYRPEYPRKPFESLAAARAWVAAFVTWYNIHHLHSALRFVTPEDRFHGRDREILENRRRVYEAARRQQPERWSGSIRNWTKVGSVFLNPDHEGRVLRQLALLEAS